MVASSVYHGGWQLACAVGGIFLLVVVPVRDGVQRLLLDWSYALCGCVQEGSHLTRFLCSIATSHFFSAATAIREMRGCFIWRDDVVCVI